MIKCPSCGEKNIICYGDIEPIGAFAGRVIFNPPRSKYYKCRNCNLYFKHPLMSNEQEKALYLKAGSESWHYDIKGRRDWQVALEWMSRKGHSGSVLDAGCWSGDFLLNVGEGWTRHGVEINEDASRAAVLKGIEIVGDDVYKISELDRKFDVVTSFDVIEHIHDPFHFVRTLTDLLSQGGLLVLASGNTESMTWRMLRNRYWYCSWPEHTSFISEKWCRFVAEKLSLKIRYTEKFSHADKRFSLTHISEMMINASYALFPGLYVNIRRLVYGLMSKGDSIGNIKSPPLWSTRKDHFVVVFSKG